jgi:mono/diheme cytochrome c family protein
MLKRLLIGTFIATVLLAVFAGTIAAQQTPPPPYAGVTNPFAWDDPSAVAAGKSVYQQSCLGCHGPAGQGVPTAKFGDRVFADGLEAKPDVDFWILSEGRLAQGMPPFKATLSEQQRWQVLTYVRSLGAGAATSPGAIPAPADAGNLALVVPESAQPGEEITLTATLLDSGGRPVQAEEVQFFLAVDFFTSGQMEIGAAPTDKDGVATLKYVPRFSGPTQVLARHGSAEATGSIALGETDQRFYQPQAGIKLPALGPSIFFGPASAVHLGAMGQAPTSAFYLPGGITSWLLLVVAAVVMVWFSYFRVVRQISHIPIRSEIRDVDTRLIPRLAMAYVITLGLFLALKVLIGPYTHFHLLH